ncbi:hypothetical protein [Kitasatospora sp. SC0581]
MPVHARSRASPDAAPEPAPHASRASPAVRGFGARAAACRTVSC